MRAAHHDHDGRRPHGRDRLDRRGARLPELIGGHPRPDTRGTAADGFVDASWSRLHRSSHLCVRPSGARTLEAPHPHLSRPSRPFSATLHVHLDRDRCMEVNVLQGRSDDVQHFSEHVLAERGVRHGKVVIMPASPPRSPPETSEPAPIAPGRPRQLTGSKTAGR